MATTITAGNATNGAAISSDNTGILELKTGTGSGTTAMTVGTGQNVTFSQSANLPNTFGFKNRIINGDMRIDQRNAGASVTVTGSAYTLDRWAVYSSQTSKYSVQQNAGSVTPPVGFTNYLGATSLSAYSVGASDFFNILQFIEGFNFADLGWGSANASPVTLSFWVRSSLTGTFGGSLRNSATNRSYPFTYTVGAANTWEQKAITIAGDTSGTWVTNNGVGVGLFFGLGVGSTFSGTSGAWAAGNFVSATGATSVVGTNGATFYITGVQLEKGSTATSFDYRPYGTELALCQRYYVKVTVSGVATVFGSGFCSASTTALYYTGFPATMRAIPTALEQSGTASDYRVRFAGTAATCSSVPVFSTATNISASYQFTVASGLTTGQGTTAESNSSNAYLAWSAEL